MDISAFSEDTFNAATWINQTFKTSSKDDENGNKEQFIGTLVSKLQLYVQQVNCALEDTSQQVLVNLPRIMKDVQVLKNESMVLKTNMSELQNDITQVEKETGECMSTLERLDDMKTKLQTAKEGLQESDGWGRLTSELDDLLEHNDVLKSCDKLLLLQKSLKVQENLPGQQDRETQVEGYKNRLEALTSPSVVQSFQSGDIENAIKYVNIFDNMDRFTQLTQYYRTVQKNYLQKQWLDIIELTENNGTNNFLSEFYEAIFENYKKQMKWCAQVFTNNNFGLIQPFIVIIELLDTLKPPREYAIKLSLKRSINKLNVLNELSIVNINFGNLLSNNIINNKLISDNYITLMKKYIYDYFNVFLTQFPNYEDEHLKNNLKIINVNEETISDTIRCLSTANNKIIDLAEQGLKDCAIITQHITIVNFVLILNNFFKDYLDNYNKIVQKLNKNIIIDNNWNILSLTIKLLENLGDFRIKLYSFEANLLKVITEYNQNIFSNQNNINNFNYKILTKGDINDFKKLIKLIKDDEKLENKNGIFPTIKTLINDLCESIHNITLKTVFLPIENYIKTIETNELFNKQLKTQQNTFNNTNTDLPDYSYAPQEYITQIGQYLLTLPQHLEPLLLKPINTLKMTLEISNNKYNKNIPCADVLLSLIVDDCCLMLQEYILQICNLNMNDAKQLATDIEYLGSVLEELGLSLNVHLQQIALLLRLPNENYLSLSNGCDPRLVTAIRQMRNIVSLE